MEVADKIIKIETTEILTDFKQHLELPYNKRILFSGPFGTGKSTFLKGFSQKVNENFFYLKIFPVNYSVSANEDVFELIKFDLLFHLMGYYREEAKLKKEDFTLLLRSQMFIMERMKFMPLLYAILGFSEKIGTPIVDFIKALEKTVGDFNAFSNDINNNKENDITTFLESIQQKRGSHHEMDAVSELIFDLIERIKTKYPKKESVLIIDDLDRLDPEHIFRLFNIFSAHYDEINDKNKFGFDKVIFVCDIENIRKIFHHKYGANVDFNGYIDKFYTTAPFDFDNRKYIKEKVSDFIDTLQFEKRLPKFFETKSHYSYKLLKGIIISLLEVRQLNLRMLHNMPIVKVELIDFKNNNGKHEYSTYNTPIIIIFHILKNFYGSFGVLEEKLNSLYVALNKEKYTSDPNNYQINTDFDSFKLLASFCLPFIFDIEEKAYASTPSYYSEKYGCFVHYSIPFGGDFNKIDFIGATKKHELNSENVLLNPYELLVDTFEVCKKRGLLK